MKKTKDIGVFDLCGLNFKFGRNLWGYAEKESGMPWTWSVYLEHESGSERSMSGESQSLDETKAAMTNAAKQITKDTCPCCGEAR